MPHLSKSNTSESTTASSITSSNSVWSSPNIGQMTEMSHEWYKKMLNDSAELIQQSIDSQFNSVDLSQFITTTSQPASLNHAHYSAAALHSIEETDITPFNSLPTAADFDFINCDEENPFINFNASLFTPNSSIQNSSSNSVHDTSPVKMATSPEKVYTSRGVSARGRKYQTTNLLAQFCQQVLSQTAHPKLNEIDSIVMRLKGGGELSSLGYDLPDKKMRSSVREWFRKRREYMATKIYRSCQRLLPRKPETSEEISRTIKQIHKNTSLLGIIIMEAKLPMQPEIEKINFVKEKIVDFYMKYPQRKIRNTTGFKIHSVKNDLYNECDIYDCEIYENQPTVMDENDLNFY